MAKVKVELELGEKAFKKLEKLTEDFGGTKKWLEKEINGNVDAFIETMGLDNY